MSAVKTLVEEAEAFVIVEGVLTTYTGDEENIVIPDGVTKIDKNVFNDNKTITSVSIPESVEEINDYAFFAAIKLTTVTFRGESDLTTIGYKAFEQCESLTTITLPNSITTIGEGAFGGTTLLTNINIPTSLTKIVEGVFADTGLTSITIPSNITIKLGAFMFSTKITSITIGEDVVIDSLEDSIDEGPFSSNFVTEYSSGGAGTYTKTGILWSKQP